eukprot:m.78301 g.78301  ORF g.78301 m.78301 type:complete len:63 (+) comp36093_c0_seq21:582-770(+)
MSVLLDCNSEVGLLRSEYTATVGEFFLIVMAVAKPFSSVGQECQFSPSCLDSPIQQQAWPGQ